MGSVAMYTCKEGFNLDGAVTRECQVDGTWSPIEPNCTPIGKYAYFQDLLIGSIALMNDVILPFSECKNYFMCFLCHEPLEP